MKNINKNLITATLVSLLITACAPVQNVDSEGASLDYETMESLGTQNIIGGFEANENSTVAKQVLMLAMVSNKGTSICSATMITRIHVLTAAHCVDDKSARIFAFFSNKAWNRFRISQNSAAFGVDPEIIQVEKVKIHPYWNGEIGNEKRPDGDLAILRLSKLAPNEFKVTPISNKLPYKGSFLLAAGFGNNHGYLKSGSGQLRSARLPILSFEQGRIKVDHRNGKSGICNGDSGGPAFIQDLNTGLLIQVGISSYVTGNPKNYCENFGFFTSIIDSLPWIQSTLVFM
jgi:V8-like Glu-specific endopeptidase